MILIFVNLLDVVFYIVKVYNIVGFVFCSGRVKIQRMYSVRYCYIYVIEWRCSDSSCNELVFVVSFLDEQQIISD